jgi:hypothetical protein
MSCRPAREMIMVLPTPQRTATMITYRAYGSVSQLTGLAPMKSKMPLAAPAFLSNRSLKVSAAPTGGTTAGR